MPLNTVQTYLKDTLNGMVLPLSQQGTVAAYIAPPNPAVIEQPLVYIWGSVSEERPKTTGAQEVRYHVDLWLYWVEDSDDPLADSLFPVVIDAITSKLRSLKYVLPAQATDPISGQVSTLISVGRDIKVDYAPARTLETESMTLYMARIIPEVCEWVNL